jgi:hypothetical protein
VSSHPEPRPIDASRYTLTYLLGEKNKNENSKSNEDWFKRLDFVNVGDDVIEALFVLEWHKIKESKVILPPPSHRRDRGAIVSFLRLGPGQKRSIIKEWRDCSLEVNFDHDSDDSNIEEGEEEGVVYEVTDVQMTVNMMRNRTRLGFAEGLHWRIFDRQSWEIKRRRRLGLFMSVGKQ